MGSRGISCLSVFIKTLTEQFSLSQCLPLAILCISSPHSRAELPWARGQCLALLCRVDPLEQPLEGPGPCLAAGSHKCAGFPRFWFPTWLAAVGIELSELSSRSEGVCALATALGAAVIPDPRTTLLWCLCWEVRSGSSGSGSRLSLINLFFNVD